MFIFVECIKDLSQPPKVLCAGQSLLFSSSQAFSLGVLISPIAPKAVSYCVWSYWAVSCRCQTKLVIMPTNIKQIVDFLRGIYPASLECQKVPCQKSYTIFVRPVFLPRGSVGIDWRWSHQKETMPFSVSWRGKGFFQCPESSLGWSGKSDTVSLSADPNAFKSRWVSLKTSRQMPQIFADESWSSSIVVHVGTQAPVWNHPHSQRLDKNIKVLGFSVTYIRDGNLHTASVTALCWMW